MASVAGMSRECETGEGWCRRHGNPYRVGRAGPTGVTSVLAGTGLAKDMAPSSQGLDRDPYSLHVPLYYALEDWLDQESPHKSAKGGRRDHMNSP